MKKEILYKIDAIEKIAESANETDIQIILLVVSGAIRSGDDNLLALLMQKIAKEILMPRVIEKRNSERN